MRARPAVRAISPLRRPALAPYLAPATAKQGEEHSMRRASMFATAIGLTAILAGAGPAFADFGAIAYDQHNCAVGRSWHYDNPRRAADVAIAECGHRGCQVVLQVGPGQCGAIAITNDCHGYGWAKRDTRDSARLAAMENCQHYNAGQCSVRTVDCNR
jgi:Domain of unknown function (DUF4189)